MRFFQPKATVAELHELAQSLGADLSAARREIAQLSSQLAAVDGRIQTLHTTMQTLDATVATEMTSMPQLRTDIGNMLGDLSNAISTLPERPQRLSAMRITLVFSACVAFAVCALVLIWQFIGPGINEMDAATRAVVGSAADAATIILLPTTLTFIVVEMLRLVHDRR